MGPLVRFFRGATLLGQTPTDPNQTQSHARTSLASRSRPYLPRRGRPPHAVPARRFHFFEPSSTFASSDTPPPTTRDDAFEPDGSVVGSAA